MAGGGKILGLAVVVGVVALALAGSSASASTPAAGAGAPTQWRKLAPYEITGAEQGYVAGYSGGGANALPNGGSASVIVGGKWRHFTSASGVVTIWAPANEPMNGVAPSPGVRPIPNTNPAVGLPLSSATTGGGNAASGGGVAVSDDTDIANAPVVGSADVTDDGSDDGSIAPDNAVTSNADDSSDDDGNSFYDS